MLLAGGQGWVRGGRRRAGLPARRRRRVDRSRRCAGVGRASACVALAGARRAARSPGGSGRGRRRRRARSPARRRSPRSPVVLGRHATSPAAIAARVGDRGRPRRRRPRRRSTTSAWPWVARRRAASLVASRRRWSLVARRALARAVAPLRAPTARPPRGAPGDGSAEADRRRPTRCGRRSTAARTRPTDPSARRRTRPVAEPRDPAPTVLPECRRPTAGRPRPIAGVSDDRRARREPRQHRGRLDRGHHHDRRLASSAAWPSGSSRSRSSGSASGSSCSARSPARSCRSWATARPSRRDRRRRPAEALQP